MRTILLSPLLAAGALGVCPAATAQHADRAPPWSQAEQIYDAEEMARARQHALHEMGGMSQTMIMADRLEWRESDDEQALSWDADLWSGGDIHRVWFKSEGEYSFGDDEFEEGEVQALYSRAVSAYWDVQAGLRYDFAPGGRTHAVVGLQGLAPYQFEVDAAAFVSTDGDVSARIETEYELLLTQRLVLQPRLELEALAEDDASRGQGAGFTHAALGARLRYEFAREFAPYVGVEWTSDLGETRALARAGGEDPDAVAIVAGLRLWW